MPGGERQRKSPNARALGALSSVGISFVLAVVIGFGVGFFLDRWLGLTPLFTIIFFFVGVAAGVINVVRAASSFGRDDGPDDDRA